MVANTALGSPLVRRWSPWAGGLVALAACLGLQSLLFEGQERIVTSVFMYVALAQAWNLIGGFAGYACFGQVLFFGLGGYTSAVLMTHAGMSFWLTLPLAGVVGAAFGALIGMPLLRLRGHYFAVATLGVAEGLREVITNMGSLTGGGSGITLPTIGSKAVTENIGDDGFYILFLLLAALAVLVGGLVGRGRYGLALRAIHQDEDAAGAAGVNTTRAKVLTLSLSGLLTGIVGAAYAFQQITIYPDRLFDVDITVLMVIMVMLGGSGTVVGPVIGAVALQFASEWLRENYTNAHIFILGLVIIVAVVLLPQGLVNYVREARRNGEYSLLANIRRYRL